MIINKEEFPFLSNFKDIIYNKKSYLGYNFQENNLLLFTAFKDRNNEFFKFNVDNIINICSEGKDKIHIYYGNQQSCYSVPIEEENINRVISELTNLVIKHKQNKSVKDL